ncbi:MAG: hypothetical protein R3261_08790 [Alphaproteobacteria bacterium]|nr:hypothetical protein [Alphaproteobacteria bacterium]
MSKYLEQLLKEGQNEIPVIASADDGMSKFESANVQPQSLGYEGMRHEENSSPITEEAVSKMALIKALEAEKQHRKLLEAKLREFQHLLSHQEREANAIPDPEFADDPRSYIDRRLFDMERKLMNDRVEQSLLYCSECYEDFDDLVKKYWPLIADEKTIQEAEAQISPAHYVYEKCKQHKFQQEIGHNPDEYRARLRAEIMEELKQGSSLQSADSSPEVQSGMPQHIKVRHPQSLSGHSNARARSGPAWSGPASLDEILNGKA